MKTGSGEIRIPSDHGLCGQKRASAMKILHCTGHTYMSDDQGS